MTGHARNKARDFRRARAKMNALANRIALAAFVDEPALRADTKWMAGVILEWAQTERIVRRMEAEHKEPSK